MTEANLQKAVATYLDDISRLYKNFIYWHTPNGGQRSKRYARFLQGQGVKAGVPDVIILTGAEAICIELKWKSSLSDVQKAFHEKLKFLNIPVYTVKAKEPKDAVNFVEAILLKHGLLQNSQRETCEKVPEGVA